MSKADGTSTLSKRKVRINMDVTVTQILGKEYDLIWKAILSSI
jgi:hypothetical protein